jgi:precorrin-2 dehydrogenase/sirohydrochlorin ferrochelatase
MLPVILDPAKLKIGLVGRGQQLQRRLLFLRNSGVKAIRLFSDDPGDELKERMGDRIIDHLPEENELRGMQLLFLCGLKQEENEKLTDLARKRGIIVNTEDVRTNCDFQIPGVVRRGDLLLTVSSGGVSPGLVAGIRKQIAEAYGEEWVGRLEEIGKAREIWKQNGASMKELRQMTNALIKEKEWFE